MESQRLDIYLVQQYPAYSRGQIQKQIAAGRVTVNGIICTTTKHAISEPDTVIFDEPDAEPLYPQAEAVDLDILFEDEAILVINKPVGMAVHPQNTQETGSLVQAVLNLRPKVVEAIYDAESPVSRLRPGIVHRLDKDTSGVIVVAKTAAVMQILATQFQEHTVEKDYQAILYGVITETREVSAPIRRKGGGDKNRMGASHNPEEGRAALSFFIPTRSWAPYPAWPEEQVTLVTVRIETGRTHQIRVHAKFIGHPVMGDTLYGNKPSIKLSEKIGVTKQVLHAAKLCLNHPLTGERMCFEAPLPSSFSQLL